MDLISVIVPIYNTSLYLKRCLDSILENTYTELEIICVNDGSTDNSLEILNEYANKDKRIIVIDQKNRGVSAARNAGIRVSKGNFVSFVDSDDWIHPQYFEMLIKAQLYKNADCVISGVKPTACCSFEYEVIKEPTIISTDINSVLSTRHARTHACGRIYRRNLIKDLFFTEGIRLGEVYVFNLSALCRKDDVVIIRIQNNLYYYYNRENSAIRTLPYTLFIPAILQSIAEYESIRNKQNSVFLLKQAIKSFLTSRYLSMFDKINNNEIITMNSIKGKLLILLNDLTLKDKLIYWTFLKFPFVYRTYRICQDRSMLDWEKKHKQKRTNN